MVLLCKHINSLTPSLTYIILSNFIPSYPIEFSYKLKFCSCKRFHHTLLDKLIPFVHASFLLIQVIDLSTLIVDYSFHLIHLIHPILFPPSRSSHLIYLIPFIPFFGGRIDMKLISLRILELL